jgi:hypothetical protein
MEAPDIELSAIEANRDSEMVGLSLYEKKSLLIQRELDAMGMGRYQWYIWSLCGLGYFLDLLWAQAFGLIATPLQNELGFSSECYRLESLWTLGLICLRRPAGKHLHQLQCWADSWRFCLGSLS